MVTMSRHRGAAGVLGGVATALAMTWASPGPAQAHGGDEEIRLIGQAVGGHDVTVITAPQNPHMGPVHVAVQLTDPKELTYVRRATVVATARFLGEEAAEVSARAQYRKPWHELHLRLERSGRWKVKLSVDGPSGEGKTSFIIEVLPDAD